MRLHIFGLILLSSQPFQAVCKFPKSLWHEPSRLENILLHLKRHFDIPHQTNPPVTVWIHGTRLLPQSMFKNFFYSKPGLHHYQVLSSKYHQYQIAVIF